MELLVWIHVMSAIIGIGPTFIMGLFFQKNQSVSQLKHSINLFNKALLYNKIGGPVAVLSGLGLVLTGNYGSWLQLWLLGALFIYLIIFAISIPLGNKLKALQDWVNLPEQAELTTLPTEQEKILGGMNNAINFIHLLSIILFSLMILKPVLF